MMKHLEDYLRAQKLSGATFAKAVGLSDPYLSKIRHGKFTPSLEVAARIERETGGAVPASSWIDAPAESYPQGKPLTAGMNAA